MLTTISTFLATAALISASPIVQQRTVPALNADAFAEAQVRDNTATRAFSSVEIQVCFGYLPMINTNLVIDLSRTMCIYRRALW
jgi:hypothetical protein